MQNNFNPSLNNNGEYMSGSTSKDGMMKLKRQSKYKQTLLSSLFIQVFFLLLGKAAEPLPLVGLMVDTFADTI